MLSHLLYVSSPGQTVQVTEALRRLHAKPIEDKSSVATGWLVSNPVLGKMTLQVHLISHLDAITPHLRQNPVDLLIYDERGPDGIEARAALSRIRDDVARFAELWGPDFLFPMSRVVAILEREDNQAMRAFELGRVHVRDVCIAPRNTSTVLRWLHGILTKGVIREERVGMALSGGGIEGFLFQIGCLWALERATHARSLKACNVFSGVSSGSIAAALMAGKVPTLEVIKALHRSSEVLPPLSSSTLFDLAGRDIFKRLITQTLGWAGLDPQKWINKTMRSIPTGFFKGDSLRDYFHEALTKFGGSDSFNDLDTELYIGATDQDSFDHVVFGRAPWNNVAVSEAMRASCALPPFFVPSQINGRWFIDGQVTKTCNLELVIERGCRLVIIIDPLKPLATLVPGSVDKQGGVYAMIQTVKALVYTRFHITLTHLTERYPDVDFIVFQPGEEAAELMAGSPMRYRIRTQLINAAYRQTMRQLRERHHAYSAKINKYGFELHPPSTLSEIEKEDAEVFAALAEGRAD
jgi:predicted acylesterase/phospholipase RssA